VESPRAEAEGRWLRRDAGPTARRYTALVPIISVFFGIVIRMFYKEHEPARFHAEYQGQQGKFDFDGHQIVGNLESGTALRLIAEWAAQHRPDLEANWEKMGAGRPLDRIRPLE
jgi:Domain of unknown function (DUF4160)